MWQPSRPLALLVPLLAALLAAAGVAGCGKSLDELLDLSRITSLSATPNPVPAPSGPGASTAFTLNVGIDANSGSAVQVYAANPAQGGRFDLVGAVQGCDNANPSCGLRTLSIGCSSRSQPARAGQRYVSCPSGGVELPTGSHRVRVLITDCDRFGSCKATPDDTAEFTLTIQ